MTIIKVEVTHTYKVKIDESIVTPEALVEVSRRAWVDHRAHLDEDYESLALFVADKMGTGDIAEAEEILEDLRKGVTITEINYVSQVIGEGEPTP